MLSIVFCFIIVSASASVLEPYYEHAGESLEYQLPCMAVGGRCMLSEKCPEWRQVPMKGLCPIKQDDAFECCYSATPKDIKDNTCRSRGGECMTKSWKCPSILLFSSATDCQADEHCCILIK